MIQVCPTDIVRASPDRIWDLLTNPWELAGWSDTALADAPEREITAGDQLVLGAGIAHRFRVVFRVREAVRPRLLSIDIRLPFGVTNDETIRDLACRIRCLSSDVQLNIPFPARLAGRFDSESAWAIVRLGAGGIIGVTQAGSGATESLITNHLS